MHNSRLANPMVKWVKMMKEISSKRKKVDADIEEIARIEFCGSLYMSEDGPVIPGMMIEAAVRGGAKKTREGKDAQSSVFATKSAQLKYKGPKDMEGLWNDESFRHQAIVTVQRAKINRCRPVFNEWKADIELQYDDSVVQKSKLVEWLNVAGLQCGLGDWHPRYGRFTCKV